MQAEFKLSLQDKTRGMEDRRLVPVPTRPSGTSVQVYNYGMIFITIRKYFLEIYLFQI